MKSIGKNTYLLPLSSPVPCLQPRIRSSPLLTSNSTVKLNSAIPSSGHIMLSQVSLGFCSCWSLYLKLAYFLPLPIIKSLLRGLSLRFRVVHLSPISLLKLAWLNFGLLFDFASLSLGFYSATESSCICGRKE